MNNSISIYVHFPFCERKCYYCDFYSITTHDYMDAYTDALLKETENWLETLKNKNIKVKSIYFGGGTPSIANPEFFDKELKKISSYLDFEENIEITAECNPGTMTLKKLEQMREAGINRLSIGIQSFLDSELKFLRRIHNSHGAIKAIEMAKEAKFENISIDLIYSLPGQTVSDLEYTLKMAAGFDVDHISAYTLIIEPNTPLYKDVTENNLQPNDQDTEAALFEITCEVLEKSSYEHYEVSNFARNGKKSIHNLNYWIGGDYIGLGPSAYGCIDGTRYSNIRNVKGYIEKIRKSESPIVLSEELSLKDRIEERIMLGLRAEGIIYNDFMVQFGFDIKQAIPILINEFLNDKLITADDNKLRLTDKGYLLCDEITVVIIQELEKKSFL